MQVRSICVLGGLGAMGRTVVECLLKESRTVKVLVADRMQPSKKLPSRVKFRKVNLLKHAELVKVLRGCSVVINSTSHHFNLPVMKVALEAKVDYLDLGGLFHYTRKQFKWHKKFQQKGRLAILGMGCAPGVANLLAKWAGEGLDRVDSVHIKVGGQAWGPASDAIPYAVGTIREELTLKPPIVSKGKWVFAPPRSGVEVFNFPAPVGKQKIFRTIHSEVATLPSFFGGVKEASFKIGFSDEVIQAVLAPRRRKKVSPPPPAPSNAAVRDAEITAAVVGGRAKGKKRTHSAFYASFSSGDHCAGDWNTAWPPAIVSLMMATKEIDAAGVFAPEDSVPHLELFKRLKRRGFKFVLKRS
jgi:lysine 6-dehydrogenase